MIERLVQILTFIAALGSGLLGGLFFIFSVCVMAALARLSPANGIAAMNSINVTILNGWFLTVFMGTALVSAALIVLSPFAWQTPASALMLAASLVFLIGIIAVTMVFNVPMNNALAAVQPDSPEGASLWQDYLARWTMWNHVRTVAGLGASALFILAFRG
jgi:uncharacterized membrane protein